MLFPKWAGIVIPANMVVSLFIVTCAYSAPTAAVRDNTALIHATCAGGCIGTAPISVSEISPAVEPHNYNLSSIADELLKPPADLSVASISPVQVTSLPAVPSAVFMVLTGFVCVSLVKDRKVWLAALAGLLWAGHIGREVLVARCSQLVEHRGSSIEQLSFTPAYDLQDVNRLRSDIEGTTYAGLLSYLQGIPGTTRSVQRRAYTLNPKRHTKLVPSVVEGYDIRHTRQLPQFALIQALCCLIQVVNRLAYISEWHFYFSPAFIFSLLARGPPE